MSRINLPEDWGPDEHPSLELLRRYQTGELPAPLSHPVERHLLACELCSDLVEGMALAQPVRVQTAVRETRGRLKHLLAQKKRKKRAFQWPVWQTAAVLLVLLFALGEVVYHHYFAIPHHTIQEETSWRVAGRVVNEAGTALSGVTVKVAGTNQKTTTDHQGEFLLHLSSLRPELIVSHPGYAEQKVRVSRSTPSVGITLSR